MVDPIFLKPGQDYGHQQNYWAPIKLGNQTNNYSTLTSGQKTDQCLCVNKTSNEYFPRNCKECCTYSICKVQVNFGISPYVKLNIVLTFKFYGPLGVSRIAEF